MQSKINESELSSFDGWIMVVVILFLVTLTFWFTNNGLIYGGIGLIILFLVNGFFILKPNDAVVGTFFGTYVGSKKDSGFFWINPLILKSRISIKIQNLATPKMKVNDKSGNPIEISAVFVWRINDTAKASFVIENPEVFLRSQCESALRQLATNFYYDNEDGESLKNDGEHVNKILKENLNRLANFAGIDIIDSKLIHLAYAQEIAHAMLKKQQAEAIVAARTKIVDGAVNMVSSVLGEMEILELASFSEREKVRLITNLMTVLVSDNNTTPTIELGDGLDS